MKLGIGTAQFGMDYGVANRTGKATRTDVIGILEEAARSGVRIIDTAPAYGSSEEILGELLSTGHGFRLVTKTIAFDPALPGRKYADAVRAGFSQSLRRLRTERVYGILIHHVQALASSGADDLMRALEDLKDEGRLARIGVSVYHPRQLKQILARYAVDLVQLPFNVYDQRFAQAGWLTRLKRAGIEVHSRSAFLQGLLLLPPGRLPERFDAIGSHHARLHRQIGEAGLTPLAACLAFCLDQADIDHVIVGCETLVQFTEILGVAASDCSRMTGLKSYAVNDESVIDPSRWSK